MCKIRRVTIASMIPGAFKTEPELPLRAVGLVSAFEKCFKRILPLVSKYLYHIVI